MLTNLARRSRSSLILTTLCAASCAEMGPDAGASQDDAVMSENGFSMNGFSMNGLSSANGFSMNGLSSNGFSMNGFSMNGFSMNGLAYNGFSMNGFSMNGLETVGGLSSTSGLMTTPGGREVIKYLVKVAYPAGSRLTAQDNMVPPNSYTFEGGLGVAPELEFGTGATGCDATCQEKVSAAMLAHVNNAGVHVGIWLVGPDAGIGWGSSPNYPYKEAGYFGNLFTGGMVGNYCSGKDMGSGDAMGRMGSPFGNNGAVLTSPYGWQYEGATSQNVPAYCSTGGCTTQNEGYASCPDPTGATTGHPVWNHVVTVWRNFESTQLYKICNKSSNKCLGVVNGSTANGATVEQRGYAGLAGQTWKILQVSQGVYKIINKTSGMSLDVNGTQVVQRPYANQAFPIIYLADQPGFLNLKMQSNPGAVFWTNWSTTDGSMIQTTNMATSDAAKWTITAIALETFDPGMTYRLTPQNAPSMAIDVCNNGATNNGNCVEQFSWWNGNGQKFFIADAGKGNVKLAMKLAKNKCLGPVGPSTIAPAVGARIEVQDCALPGTTNYNQSWITVQKDNAPGVFMLRNAANPNVCLDVTGNNGNNGSLLQLNNCNSGALNQQFAATVAP